jgi:hypothetical protein
MPPRVPSSNRRKRSVEASDGSASRDVSETIGAERKKPVARRGRPPGSKNKNWTSKIVAASFLAQERERAAQQRSAAIAAERAFAALPPGLRAALGSDPLAAGAPGFGYASVAAAASEAAATFAARHAALQAEGGTFGGGDVGTSGEGARDGSSAASEAEAAFARLGNDAEISLRCAALAARRFGFGFGPGFGQDHSPLGFGSNPYVHLLGAGSLGLGVDAGFGPGAGFGGLGGLDGSALARLGLADPNGAAAVLAEARERAASARANHLMHIASVMNPTGAAGLDVADLNALRASRGQNQEGGCCVS